MKKDDNKVSPTRAFDISAIHNAQDLAYGFVEALINSNARYSLHLAQVILRDNGVNIDQEGLQQWLFNLGITKTDGSPTALAEIADIAEASEAPDEAPAILTGRGLYYVICMVLTCGKEVAR